jgi:hypothetical protein
VRRLLVCVAALLTVALMAAASRPVAPSGLYSRTLEGPLQIAEAGFEPATLAAERRCL